MKRLSHIICLFLSLTALSCVREDFPYEALDEAVETVEVSLDLFVARENAGTAETKAIDDPTDASATKIRNINILQFDGTDESAPIVGEVRYLSDEADPNDEERYLNLDKIRLADSQGKKHTVVFLANTFTKLPQVDSLGEMKAFFRTLDKESDVFGHKAETSAFPGSNNLEYYQRLNAVTVSEITNGTILKGALRRSMARVKINITNSGTDGLVIDKVQMCNVSRKDWYVTDYRYIDETDTEQYLFTEAFQDIYDPADSKRMDYAPLAWKGDSDGTGTASYTFYVPANQRGTYDSNLLPQEKNRCPNADGATFVRISGYYGAAHDIPVVYTFYLGGNLYNDFNLKPNTSYTYNFTLAGKGDSVVDDRIEDMATVNFDVDANCYILNPPPMHSRSYTFNAIHRPNIFWGERYGLNAKYPNYIIDATKTWKAKIIWSDFEMTKNEANAFLVKKNGDGSGNYMDDSQRIKVTVPAGMKGNVIVGMYIDNPDNILWSWHLWITDYQPDNIEGHAPIDGTYIYPVTEGAVHRYKGSPWDAEGALYKNGYIMDRYLGALDDKYHKQERGGGLRYQFGRKDPFPLQNSAWAYDSSGNATEQPYPQNIPTVEYSILKETTGGANVPYSVNNPRTFIQNAGEWTGNDIFNPAEFDNLIEWQDPKANERHDNEEQGPNMDKSFFDPCPPGRVHGSQYVQNALGNYTEQDSWYKEIYGLAAYQIPKEKLNCVSYSSGYQGLGALFVYYLNGYYADKDNPDATTILFPINNGNSCSMVHSYPISQSQCKTLFMSGSLSVHTDYTYMTHRASTYLIRCIRENY